MDHSEAQDRQGTQYNADLTQEYGSTDHGTATVGGGNFRHRANNGTVKSIANTGKETAGDDP